MIYQGKEVIILSKKTVFGKEICEVRILYSNEVKTVPFSELSDGKKIPTDAEISYKVIAAKIKNEVFQLVSQKYVGDNLQLDASAIVITAEN